MRINERQLGFFLSDVPEVMRFTYSPHNHKLYIFINVSTTGIGKEICLEWCLERFSLVMKRISMEVRVYDYLQRERQLVCLFQGGKSDTSAMKYFHVLPRTSPVLPRTSAVLPRTSNISVVLHLTSFYFNNWT
jgi:hypothetical protein